MTQNISKLVRSRRSERSASFVIIAGITTSVISLVGVYLLNRSGSVHVMGWYLDRIVPIGALLVGAAAGTGYGITSWFSGVKITRRLLWMVLLLQVGAYFAAQYIEFSSLHLVQVGSGKSPGFFRYYDWMARSFAWRQDMGGVGHPLGAWGYFFRGLEILGFAVGGWLVPALLHGYPYCEQCQLYMKKSYLAFIPAAVTAKSIEREDWVRRESVEAEHKAAAEKGNELLASIEFFAQQGDTEKLDELLDELRTQSKTTLKLPRKIILRLVCCKACHSGKLSPVVLAGAGKHQHQNVLPESVLSRNIVEHLRAKLSAA